MKFKRVLPMILTAGMIFSGITPTYTGVSSVYAQEGKSITAEDLTFTSDEKEAKQIVFSYEGIDEEHIGFEYPSGTITVNALGEVTPLRMGEVNVKIFDTTDSSVFAIVKVSVWLDLLPDLPPNVDIKAESTASSITVINNTKDIDESCHFEYSLNGVIWQKETEFKGLSADTEYSIYYRFVTNDGYVVYVWSGDNLIKIKTKEESTEPEVKEYTLSQISLREGNIYEINLTNFEGKEIIDCETSNKNVAKITVSGTPGSQKAYIEAVKEGETTVSFVVDYSTETKTIYGKYIYPVKVTPVPKVEFTVDRAEYEKVYLNYDKSKIPSGYTVKFSFDQMSWTAGDYISRKLGSGIDQSTVYAAYFDSDGYMRSIVTSADISLVGTAKKTEETVNKPEIELDLNKDYDFYIEKVKNERELTYYNYYSSDTSVGYFYEEGLLNARKPGNITVKVVKDSTYFDEKGNTIIEEITYVYPVKVPEPKKDDKSSSENSTSSPSPSPSPTPSTGKDDQETDSDKVILTVPKVTLSESFFTYNGKEQKPKLTVKVGRKIMKEADYTVTFGKGRKEVGRYKVEVSLKDSSGYRGTFITYYYIIPKKVTVKSVKRSGSKVTVKWKKGSKGITGYELSYSKDSSFQKGVKTVRVKGIGKTSKKIKAKKGYYVRIRAYKYDKSSKKYINGKWSSVKKVK